MTKHPTLVRALLGSIVLAEMIAFCLFSPAAHAQAWQRPHADGANNGFLNVTTAPAKTAPITVPGLGKFAVGAGPVVAPDGTVYLGTREGKLIALHPDGSPFWSRDITRGQSIVASPVISSDGSIYVVGVRQYRDNRAGANPPGERAESMLHHFTSSGGWLEQTPFPMHDRGPAALAAPNIWRSGNTEIIIVPTRYQFMYGGGHSVELIAFSTDSSYVARQVVTSYVPEVHGGAGVSNLRLALCLTPAFLTCILPPGFNPGEVRSNFVLPPPSVDIFTAAGGAIPFVIVSDHIKDLVGYSFSGTEFTERFRVHSDDRFMRSAPMTLPDGRTLIGIQSVERDPNGGESVGPDGGIVFAGPNADNSAPITGLRPVFATPTRMADGRVFIVGGYGHLAVLQGNQVVAKIDVPSGSLVSAAASRTHVFVSTADAFLTYDTNSLAEVARFDWAGGGRNPPAIGPKGHVYAIASDMLFIFPPSMPKPGDTVAEPGAPPVATGAATAPEAPAEAPQAREQSYQPPMTVSGNRLFACEKLDGDDCGKGDYRTIAKAFCAAQGFTAADDIDVDTKKVKAETLDGRFCAKNKCKVFDRIVCKL